ncbi:MAG TPA: FtsX-like permease family protein, partial [Planctomycetota bacterium]|nr:FtsX-like permease family protein [Planctomycetota bacterium]
FATLSMMVTEKTRDVGILSALGATGAEVSAVFVDVGVAMTIAGEILGLGLGLLVATRLRPIEDFLADRFGLRLFNPDVYLITHLPSEIHGAQIVTLLALTLAAGVLFSLVPAARAARLDPAAALRYE